MNHLSNAWHWLRYGHPREGFLSQAFRLLLFMLLIGIGVAVGLWVVMAVLSLPDLL